jgi:hypothetical protein
LLLISSLSNFKLAAQLSKNYNYGLPLDVPLKLAGSFGEIRLNHLHSGTDFRTLGITGLKVRAIEDGYVSRIKIEPDGYGKAIYITHPNGYVSLYGHLEKFREDIEKYCKNEQYKQNAFVIDATLKPREINVKKGDFIAWSGNSGGTSGPHLHLEIREEKTQDPVNPLLYYLKNVSDTIPPVIEKVWIYPLSEKSAVNRQFAPAYYNVISSGANPKLANELPILVKGDIGIGIQTYDRADGTNIRSGVYSIDLYENNNLIFQQAVDKYSFSEVRYVNSLIDYEYYIRNKIKINRLYIQPNNHFSVYKQAINRGVIGLNDTSWYQIRIVVKDAFRNETELKFKLRGDLNSPVVKIAAIDSGAYEQKMFYQKDNEFLREKIRVFVPKNALYDDFLFDLSTLPQTQGYYSELYQVHNRYVPLHKSASLRIKPNNLPQRLNGKALLLNLDERGQVLWSGGNFKDGYVTSNIRAFGRYIVGVDTIPPILKLNSNKLKNNNFTHWKRISFTIKDDLSGIKSYNGFIDGHWVLFEYDPKENLLFYEFDADRLKFGTKHTLDLTVTDEKNNTSKYHTEFTK